MQTIHAPDALRAALNLWRSLGERVALVPTMGALHAGHMALVADAKTRANRVVVSIFVNPTQFGPDEDLDRYPRRLAQDRAMLADAGVDLLWAPDVATMYPGGFGTSIHVAGLSEPFEGVIRPGHFDGVATVVAKLFNQVRPDIALFGEKDFQQLAVIRQLSRDLDLGVAVVGVPTRRDDDGLALSSRNTYLSANMRAIAPALPAALDHAAAALVAGGDVAATLAAACARLLSSGFDKVDYLALADAATLATLDSLDRPARLLVAAHIGGVRLIDNLAVDPRI